MDSRLFWLAAAAFVGAIEGGLIAGLLPLIGADLGVTLGQAGLLVLFYSIAYAFGPPLLALLLGGVGRRRILSGAEACFAICALLIVLVIAIYLVLVWTAGFLVEMSASHLVWAVALTVSAGVLGALVDANATSLHGFYRGAPQTARRIAPEEIGVQRIGHFGFFRRQFAESLWAPYLLPELG